MPRRLSPPTGAPPADALQVLIDASRILLSVTEGRSVFSEIFTIAGRLFSADAYAIWRQVDTQGTWRAIATRGLSPSYRTEITSITPDLPTSIRAIEDTLGDEWLAPFRPAYEAEGVRSMLVVRLALKREHPGTITFYWRTPRHFTEQDYSFAFALANLAAAAINHEELQEASQREKQRLAFLAEASSILASSLDYETTLNRVAYLAVPRIADWCTVHILENGSLTRLVVAHADPAMQDIAQQYATRYPEQIRPEQGLGKVIATGETEAILEITEAMVLAAAQDEEHAQLLKSLEITSSIAVALQSRGKMLGAIRLLAAGPAHRHFTQEDIRLAEDLARRAAVAIENAQLHQAVVQQQSQLRLAHAAARIGSWSWDLVKRELKWSEEYRKLHGVSADTPASEEAGSQLIHPEDRERVQAELQSYLNSDADQLEVEHRSMTPDGRVLWLQSRGSIQRDATGKPISLAGVTMDVTESRLAEAALRRTEKLAAAGRLAATVAHEVNNPLESLTNLVYLATQAEKLPDDARLYLHTAESELSRIAHIVRQTLGFYRDSAQPKPVDVGQIVNSVIELYHSRAESRMVQLSSSAEPGLIAVANAGELKQVIANLVSNALDATPAGGTVRADVQRHGGSIRITVADTGSGIREEHLGHLFEPFFTTEAEVGTGLGLWVSKGIIEKHSGTIDVSSSTEPGRAGTTFTIELPAEDV